jgi:hypothetical protein
MDPMEEDDPILYRSMVNWIMEDDSDVVSPEDPFIQMLLADDEEQDFLFFSYEQRRVLLLLHLLISSRTGIIFSQRLIYLTSTEIDVFEVICFHTKRSLVFLAHTMERGMTRLSPVLTIISSSS